MAKDSRGLRDFSSGDADPEVVAMLRDRGQQAGRKPARPAVPRAAGQEKASRKAEKDAARNRRMIDIDVELEKALEELAAELGVPVSSLINWLVARGLQVTTVDDLIEARQPSRSMRFEYILPAPPPQRGARRGRR